MRIDRLSLKGITRFTEPVSLDFRDVPAGVIAVVGDNGAGKTTLIESMFAGYFGEMPSRSSKPLFDLATGTDAYIDVEASFTGRGSYRSRINLDSVRRTRDAILEHIDADGQHRILTDGKISTFDAKVAELLPRPAVLLASAFAAQNRQGSFATADRKARKDLFSALLGHEHFDNMAITARAAAGLVDRRLAEIQAQIDFLAPQTLPGVERNLHDEGNQLQQALLGVEQRQAGASAAIDAALARVAPLKAQDAEHRAARTQYDALQRRKDGIAQRIQQLRDATAASEREFIRKQHAIDATRDQAIAVAQSSLAQLPSDDAIDAAARVKERRVEADHAASVAPLQTRIVNNQGLRARASDVRAAVAALQTLQADVAKVTADIETSNRLRADLAETVRQCDERESSLRHWAPARLEADRAYLRLKDTPFGERCAEAGCAFVQDAAAAKARLPEITDGVAAHEVATAALDQARRALAERVALETDLLSQRRQLEQRIATAHHNTLQDHEALKGSEARLKELETDVAALEARRTDALTAIGREAFDARAAAAASRERLAQAIADARATATREHDALSNREISDEEAARVLDVTDAERDATDVAQSLTRLADVVRQGDTIAAELSAAETAVGLRRADLANVQQEHARLTAQVEAFERRRSEFQSRLDARERLKASADALRTDLVEWQALDRVFGRNGLPVFEIDAAGPGVSAIANDLLQACFGGRFAVELATQEAKAGGKGLKETFDIRVWDAERGGDARDLADLSGGEQVIVDEAIKSAIALFGNNRNILPIETCWRDETAGALRPDTALKYFAMLQRIRERGGFHHLFVVTHNPDLAALADVQLVVANGGAQLVYPPFPPFAATSEAA